MTGFNYNRRPLQRHQPALSRETHGFPAPDRVPRNVIARPLSPPPMRRIKDS